MKGLYHRWSRRRRDLCVYEDFAGVLLEGQVMSFCVNECVTFNVHAILLASDLALFDVVPC